MYIKATISADLVRTLAKVEGMLSNLVQGLNANVDFIRTGLDCHRSRISAKFYPLWVVLTISTISA